MTAESGDFLDAARAGWRVRHPRDRMRLGEAEARRRPFLFLRDGDDQQRIHHMPDAGRLTLGRQATCDVVIDWDPLVSRVHAALELVGTTWTVIDDGLSRNGTFLNARRITARQRLNDGDLLRLGATNVEFREPTAAAGDLTVAVGGDQDVALTPAQRRVLVALARQYGDGRGYPAPTPNREIAAELVVTVDAVKATLRVLFEKFHVEDLPQNQKRAALAERALACGAITRAELTR